MRAVSVMIRVSEMVRASGFSQYRCRPLRRAPTAATAWPWSGSPDDGIDALLVEKEAEIVVSLGGRELLSGGLEVIVIDVAQGDDVFVGDVAEVVIALVGDADDTNISFSLGEAPRVIQPEARKGSGQPATTVRCRN
ncbi:MAG: hypothetical protein U1G07_19055 [Verrucomicrobiota bacterium]